MPRYLRWIVSVTSGLTAQFAFFMLVGALAVGTGNTELDQGIGLGVTLGSTFITVITALAINDWLASRYPVQRREPERVG